MIQERAYSSAIFFGRTICLEHLENENMVFRAVLSFLSLTFESDFNRK